MNPGETFMKLALGAAALGLVSTLALAVPASAEEVLIFSTSVPASNPSNDQIYKPLSEAINKAGAGEVRIDLRIGVAMSNLGNFYERVSGDVVQISNGIISGITGKFKKTEVITLPFLVESSEIGSVAYWRLYKSGLLADEFDEVVPMVPIAYPPSTLHVNKPVEAADKLGGIKIASGTAVGADIVRSFGATPISVQLGDLYESLQRGVTDGAVMTWTAYPTFKLFEVSNYHIEVPLGGAAGGAIMNKKRFDSLTAKARDAVMQGSGEAWARIAGKYFDNIQAEGKRSTLAMKGQTDVEPTPAQLESYRKTLLHVSDEWVKRTKGGDKVLAKYRELIEDVKAGK